MPEPLLHSHITDVLPEDHPLAHQNVNCVVCRDILHAGNNECMQPWLETKSGAYCILCWYKRYSEYDDEGRYGL